MKDKFYGSTNKVISCFTAKEKVLERINSEFETVYQSRYGYISFQQWTEGNISGFGLYYIHDGYKYRHVERLRKRGYYSLRYMSTLAKRFAKDVIDGYWDEDK